MKGEVLPGANADAPLILKERSPHLVKPSLCCGALTRDGGRPGVQVRDAWCVPKNETQLLGIAIKQRVGGLVEHPAVGALEVREHQHSHRCIRWPKGMTAGRQVSPIVDLSRNRPRRTRRIATYTAENRFRPKREREEQNHECKNVEHAFTFTHEMSLVSADDCIRLRQSRANRFPQVGHQLLVVVVTVGGCTVRP